MSAESTASTESAASTEHGQPRSERPGQGALQFPLHISLRRSRRAVLVLLGLHLLCAGLVVFNPLTGLARLPWLSVLLLLVLAASLAHNLLAQRRFAAGLVLHRDGCLQLLPFQLTPAALAHTALSAAAAPERCPLLGEVVDFGWALWFTLDRGRRPQRLMLWRDHCSPEHWRLLCLWLRHQAGSSGGERS